MVHFRNLGSTKHYGKKLIKHRNNNENSIYENIFLWEMLLRVFHIHRFTLFQFKVFKDNGNKCNKEDINELKYLGVCCKRIYHQHSKLLFRFVIANIVQN